MRLVQGHELRDQVGVAALDDALDVLVTPEKVDTTLELARDQQEKIQSFPFEKPLTEIVASYMN